jgi:hypothetical protein
MHLRFHCNPRQKIRDAPDTRLPFDLVHVSTLGFSCSVKKCLKTPMDSIINDKTPLEEDLSYPEPLIKLLDQQDHVLRCKMIKFYNMQWSNHSEREGT